MLTVKHSRTVHVLGRSGIPTKSVSQLARPVAGGQVPTSRDIGLPYGATCRRVTRQQMSKVARDSCRTCSDKRAQVDASLNIGLPYGATCRRVTSEKSAKKGRLSNPERERERERDEE
jgi:hypothetical protein